MRQTIVQSILLLGFFGLTAHMGSTDPGAGIVFFFICGLAVVLPLFLAIEGRL